ncbi:hypothetical protein BZB76_3244 [Actinomadura pelletieri DSM 43383]|uniref:Uncharacterized protein n=1 Tax=Actinomadura pelletieri DSM 43383 TaxID=1120940 RepID=A0A495QP63_9ACTN|nr:hypothetical protein BZB76_3244 [Actinomadura pelletieri DSM 43383]
MIVPDEVLPLEHEVKLYHRVSWNGGHLIGTAFGGPGERIKLVGTLEKFDQAQKGTPPLNDYRKPESYFGYLQQSPHSNHRKYTRSATYHYGHSPKMTCHPTSGRRPIGADHDP